MDDTIITKEQEAIEEGYNNLPSEVADFMWSDSYAAILSAIQSAVPLSPEQADIVKIKSYDLLLGVSTMESAASELIDAGFTPDQAAKTLYLINEEIIEVSKNLTEFYTLDPEEESPSNAKLQEAPSPADVLESLKARMTTSSTIAPSARKNGVILDDIKRGSNVERPTIDPYREIPK